MPGDGERLINIEVRQGKKYRKSSAEKEHHAQDIEIPVSPTENLKECLEVSASHVADYLQVEEIGLLTPVRSPRRSTRAAAAAAAAASASIKKMSPLRLDFSTQRSKSVDAGSSADETGAKQRGVIRGDLTVDDTVSEVGGGTAMGGRQRDPMKRKGSLRADSRTVAWSSNVEEMKDRSEPFQHLPRKSMTLHESSFGSVDLELESSADSLVNLSNVTAELGSGSPKFRVSSSMDDSSSSGVRGSRSYTMDVRSSAHGVARTRTSKRRSSLRSLHCANRFEVDDQQGNDNDNGGGSGGGGGGGGGVGVNSCGAADDDSSDGDEPTGGSKKRVRTLDESELQVALRRAEGFKALLVEKPEGGVSVKDGHRSSSLSSTQVEFERLLLFAGVQTPHGWCNPWWVCYVGWRFLVFISLILGIYNIGFYLYRHLWDASFSYVIPMVLSTLAAGNGYFWLPRLVSELGDAGAATLTPAEARNSLSVATLYIAAWLGIGALLTAAVAVSTGRVLDSVIVFFLSSCTTPVLGAVLLALSVEMALAKRKVHALTMAARERRLTRGEYVEVVAYVQNRSLRWQIHLNGLASIAVYCTLGLVVLLRFGVALVRSGTGAGGSGDDIDDDEFQNDDGGSTGGDGGGSDNAQYGVYLMAVLGKETCLVFFLLFLVMGVNDNADSIITVLIVEPWGALGSAEEAARLDLLFLATTFAVKPEAVVSWWAYMITPRTRPISFRVCTLRITRDFFLAASVSLAATTANVVLRAAI